MSAETANRDRHYLSRTPEPFAQYEERLIADRNIYAVANALKTEANISGYWKYQKLFQL